jgi:alanine racemase
MTPHLTVDLDAIASNWRMLSDLHAAPVAAVVKADGYGLGAAAVAPRLLAEGARHFFVAHVSEAVPLRPLIPGAMLAVLNGFSAAHTQDYLDFDLVPVLGSLAELQSWQRLARSRAIALPTILHVDTGMNRLGLDETELNTLTAEPGRLAGLDLLYVMTHLANAENPEHADNAAQHAGFAAACARLPASRRSLANSSGIFLGPDFRSDLARPGAALYGINPVPGRPNPMRPTCRLTAEVLQIRRIEAGTRVGYNGVWTAGRPSRIATVALGYADGYHRMATNRAEAGFDGARIPLIGRVSMDLSIFDATDHPRLTAGDRLEMIGPAVPPDEVAGWFGTNGYEVLTSLGARATRSYAAL